MDSEKLMEEHKARLEKCSYTVETLVKGVCPFTKFYEHKVVFIGKTGSRTEFLYTNPRAGVYSAEFFKDFANYAEFFNDILLYNRYWAKGQPVSVVDRNSGEYYHIDDASGNVRKSTEPVGYFLMRAIELRRLLGEDNVNLIEMKLPLSEYVDSLQQGDTFDGMPVYRDIITNYYMNSWRG
nr:MAG TPA: hypothetical protein [Caudoviricetes sp.]